MIRVIPAMRRLRRLFPRGQSRVMPSPAARACTQSVALVPAYAPAIVLLAVQAGLLAYSATVHAPTMLEPAQLAAGISNWQFGRFELFRVNPPLVRMIAALPVLAAGCNTDWRRFRDTPGSRSEFAIGSDFVTANGVRSLRLFTIARWACIPITLTGGVICFYFARELFESDASGLLALTLWCVDPNILAHGELITTDAAATTFGIGATYFFWRWLRAPGWKRAAAAGFVMGVAELAKLTWLMLFGVWPALWLFWRITERWAHRGVPRLKQLSPHDGRAGNKPPLTQLLGILALALYILNAGYMFQGTFERLRDFDFVSDILSGGPPRGTGNRLRGSWVGGIPVPLPRQYLLGLDTQKRDCEDFPHPSYLRGVWKRGGWWYYYLYGLAVKTTHGSQILLAFVILNAVRHGRRPGGDTDSSPSAPPIEAKPHDIVFAPSVCRVRRDLVVLLAPAVSLLAVASCQSELGHHFRYILPVFACLAVASGALLSSGKSRRKLAAVVGAVCWSALSVIAVYPHHLAYFNEAAGGPMNGHRHLLGSSVDWGQDLTLLRRWLASRPDRQSVYLAYHGAFDPTVICPRCVPAPGMRTGQRNQPVLAAIRAGWYAISPTYCHGSPRLVGNVAFFHEFQKAPPAITLSPAMALYELKDSDLPRFQAAFARGGLFSHEGLRPP